MNNASSVLPRPAPCQKIRPTGGRAAAHRQNAMMRATNGGMQIQMPAYPRSPDERRSPDLAPAHAPAAFHRFRQKRPLSTPAKHTVHIAVTIAYPAAGLRIAEYHQHLATLTSSCLNTAPTAAIQHLDRRGFIAVSPQKELTRGRPK